MATIDDLLTELRAHSNLLQSQVTNLDALNTTMARSGGGPAGGGDSGRRDLDNSYRFLSTSSGGLAQKLVRYGQQSDAGFSRLSTGLSTFQKSIADGTKGFNNTLKASGDRFTQELISGETTAQEFSRSIQDNIKALREMRNAGDITTEQFKEYRLQLYALQSTTMATVKATETVGKAFSGFTSVIDGAGKVAGAIQSGGEGIGASAKIAQLGMSGLASGAEKVGGLLKSLGPLGAMAGPYGAAIGGAVTILGAVIEQFGAGTKEVIEKSFPILEAQTTRLYNAFQTASSAGAMFGDGLTGITQASLDAGMGTVEFTKILKDNSADLATAVGGVTGGARAIAKASKEMELSGVRQELANFGISIGEQNSLLAQTMGAMRRTGQSFNTETLAKTTAQYAKDLKLIADITGEDAKTREKAAAEASNTLQFQMELNKLAPDQKKQVEASVAAMGPENAKMFREMVVSGGQLISEETNTLAMMMPGMANQVTALYENFKRGNTGVEATFTTMASFSDQIKREGAQFGADFALALQAGVSDPLSKAAASALTVYNDAVKITPETVQTVLTEFKKIKDETDPAAKNITEMALQSQKFAALLDQKTLPVIGKFASLVAEFNGKIIQAIAEFDRMMGNRNRTSDDPAVAATERELNQARARLQANQNTPVVRNDTGQIVEDQRTQAQMDVVEQQRKLDMQHRNRDAFLTGQTFDQDPGNADGGIVTGDIKGYLAKLHGTEAVLPLENKEAMVKIKTSLFGDSDREIEKSMREISSSNAAMINELYSSLKSEPATNYKSEQTAMLESMIRPNMQTQDRMMEVMTNKFDEMISLLKDVSNHTELTSSRVA